MIIIHQNGGQVVLVVPWSIDLKKCNKWILSEQEVSYLYEALWKCKQINILPLFFRFNLLAMYLFHKIVYKIV